MIAIINVSKSTEPTGEHEYVIRINEKIITRFKHNRKTTLYDFLRKAADAVDLKRKEDLKKKISKNSSYSEYNSFAEFYND